MSCEPIRADYPLPASHPSPLWLPTPSVPAMRGFEDSPLPLALQGTGQDVAAAVFHRNPLSQRVQGGRVLPSFHPLQYRFLSRQEACVGLLGPSQA